MSEEQQKHFNRVSYKERNASDAMIIANVSRYVSFEFSTGYWNNELSYFTPEKIERMQPHDDNITIAHLNFNDGQKQKMYLNLPFDQACKLVHDIRTGRHRNNLVDLREQTIFPESPAFQKDKEEHYKAYRDKAQKWAFK